MDLTKYPFIDACIHTVEQPLGKVVNHGDARKSCKACSNIAEQLQDKDVYHECGFYYS